MNAIRSMADRIIDTSDLTVHQLRQAFRHSRFPPATPRQKSKLPVTLVSFGFKHGIPVDADLVFDVRFLPNPHFVQRLRPKTGRDRVVIKFMEDHRATGELLDRLTDLLKFLIPQYVVGREELPDDRHRLHRRPPPIGDDRRSAEENPQRRARSRSRAFAIGTSRTIARSVRLQPALDPSDRRHRRHSPDSRASCDPSLPRR